MELDKTMKIDFPTSFYNISKIFPCYGKGPMFPVSDENTNSPCIILTATILSLCLCCCATGPRMAISSSKMALCTLPNAPSPISSKRWILWGRISHLSRT